MPAQEDNVSLHPTNPAARAQKAMQEYQRCVFQIDGWQEKAILQVAEYGAALLEGRAANSSNQAFSKWVTDNQLDSIKPWDDRRERTAAMEIAKIFVDGSTPVNAFDDCSNTRPTDIMKWYRDKHPAPAKALTGKNEARASRDAEIVRMKQAGTPAKEIAKKIGVVGRTIHKVLRDKTLVQEAAKQAVQEQAKEGSFAAAEANLSEKSKLTIADAIRVHKERLDKEFQVKVSEEVRHRLDKADDAVRRNYEEVQKTNVSLRQVLAHRGAIFTQEEYKTIYRCLHPDNSASMEMRSRAFDLVRQNEARLTYGGSK